MEEKALAFENHIKNIMIELELKSKKYEDDITNNVVNSDGENTKYFKGKADAYRYSAKQIRECLRWYGIL